MVRSTGSMTTMDNQEEILDALNDFEKKPSQEIPPVLEQFLQRIAKTGETLFPWPRLKPLLVSKLDGVMKHFNQEVPGDHFPMCPNVENVRYDDMRSRILSSLDAFHGAPFTIQRLCELITNPKRHYSRSDKFLRGIEKNVLVVSTVDPFGRKIVSESRNLVNGLDTNGQVELRDGVAGSNLPPLWVTKSSVGVWPFHAEGDQNSTVVCPLDTMTGKDSNPDHESMDSQVSTVQESNEVLQHSEDITNSPALHPVQEAVVETSDAQPSSDVISNSVDGHPVEEITSESVEIHSVLVENCAIPESLSNFSATSVVTSNVEKDSFSSEVTSDVSLTVASDGVCGESESAITHSNTVSVVTSLTVQECVLSSQSLDSGTSEVVLDSAINKPSSEHLSVEHESRVNDGSQQQTVLDTSSTNDECVSNSYSREAAPDDDSSERPVDTCNNEVSSSESVTADPEQHAVIHPTSSTDPSGHLTDQRGSDVSVDTSHQLVECSSVNDSEDLGSTGHKETADNVLVEEVKQDSSQNDTCLLSSIKPDSTLAADSSSINNGIDKPDTGDCKRIVETDNHDAGDCTSMVGTEKSDLGDSEAMVETNTSNLGDCEAVAETNTSNLGDSEAMAETNTSNLGECEAMVETDKSDLGNCEAVVQTDKSNVDDCEAMVESDVSNVHNCEGVLKTDVPDTNCHEEMSESDKSETGDVDGMVAVNKPDSGACEGMSVIGKPDTALCDGVVSPSSCSSEQDTRVLCSSTVEEVSHSKDTSSESVTPNLTHDIQQLAAAPVTEVTSVETTSTTDISVSPNKKAKMELDNDKSSLGSVEPMEQD